MLVLGLFLGLVLFFAISAHRGQLHWEEYEMNEYGARDPGDAWSGGYLPNGLPIALNGGIATDAPIRMSDEN